MSSRSLTAFRGKVFIQIRGPYCSKTVNPKLLLEDLDCVQEKITHVARGGGNTPLDCDLVVTSQEFPYRFSWASELDLGIDLVPQPLLALSRRSHEKIVDIYDENGLGFIVNVQPGMRFYTAPT
jgi:hypothetical protein